MSLPDYFTPRAGEGLRYPRSGVLVGEGAELLRLKSVFAAEGTGVGSKTAQRYFAGADGVSDDARDEILVRLVGALLPRDTAPTLAIADATGLEHVAFALLDILGEYDRAVTSLNGLSFPLTDAAFALVPYARLAVLDLGIRWGAYQWTRTGGATPPNDLPAWLRAHALRDVIDAHRKGTLADLARECEVSENTMDAWRADASLPTRDRNLDVPADALAAHSGKPQAEVLLALRLAVAGTAFRAELERRLGSPSKLAPMLAADFLGVLATTARLVREHLDGLASDLGGPPRATLGLFAVALVRTGARAPGAHMLCDLLARQAVEAWRMNVAHDFLALPGDRFERLAYWARSVGSFKFQRAKMLEQIEAGALPPLPFAVTDDLWELLPFHELRMDGYDRPVDVAGGHVLRIKNPPAIAALNRADQAAQARSVGDFVSALEHVDAAIRHQPQNAQLHFTRGAYLGDLVALGRLDLLDEAIQECELAHALDKSQGQPINEVAIIKSNARLYEEAELAFERAATLCDWWSHHHYGRGNNLLPLRRYDDARRSFERCLELEPSHTWAKKRLAAVLWALGEKRLARSWATKAKADDGVDPLDDVERHLTLHVPS